MARATFVKKARKDHPDGGIKKGESYYWWEFRFGGKYYSKTAPKLSQLTQSEFWGQAYEFIERLQEITPETPLEDLESECQSLTEEIRALGEECQEKLDNMPEQLQDADSGQMLQERVEGCEEWASELEGIDFSIDEDDSEDEKESRMEAICDEVHGCEYSGS